ncbi:MAG: hypothetical protein GF364_16340 [Candidatus Lokiarchaeota archaeon]|nr:hypothetical protein [Candidatus Lokiarchaeota archaeon]
MIIPKEMIPEWLNLWFMTNIIKDLDLLTSILSVSIVSFLLIEYYVNKNPNKGIWILKLLAPGIAIHELSHAVMCILSGKKIKKIVLFDSQFGGGYVSTYHSAKKESPTVSFMITFAPLFSGSAIAYYLTRYFIETSLNFYSSVLVVVLIFIFVTASGPSWVDIKGFISTLKNLDMVLRDTIMLLLAVFIYNEMGQFLSELLINMTYIHLIIILLIEFVLLGSLRIVKMLLEHLRKSISEERDFKSPEDFFIKNRNYKPELEHYRDDPMLLENEKPIKISPYGKDNYQDLFDEEL